MILLYRLISKILGLEDMKRSKSGWDEPKLSSKHLKYNKKTGDK